MFKIYFICLFLLFSLSGEMYAQLHGSNKAIITPTPPPVINSFSPQNAPAGTLVTITGQNFDSAAGGNMVYFGKTPAVVTSENTTQIVVQVPKAAGYNTISVYNKDTNSEGTSSKYFDLTFPLKSKMTAVNFEVNTTFPVAANQSNLAYGDLDGDGKTDIAVANAGGTTISLFRNIEPGNDVKPSSFATKVDLPISSAPDKIEIADLDADGKPDIVVTTENQLILYKNTSVAGAAFNTSDFQQIVLPFTIHNDILAIADMNGDGRPDIVVEENRGSGDSFSTNIVILRNGVTPGLLDANSFSESGPTPYEGGITSIVVADFDGDGVLDIIAPSIDYNNIEVFHGQGSGNNLTYVTSLIPTNGGSFSAAVADFDGDGKPDIVVSGYGENVIYVYQNNSTVGNLNNLSFALKNKLYTGNKPTGIDVGDLDGDGKPDIAVVNSGDKTISIFRNSYSTSSTSGSWFDPKILLDLPETPDNLHIADINNDGLPDLLISDNAPGFTLIKNEPVAVPKINFFSPVLASAGSVVLIHGAKFNNDASAVKVYFGSRQGQVKSVTDTLIQAIVPAGVTLCRISVVMPSIKRSAWSSVPFKGTFKAKKTIERSDFKLSYSLPLSAGPGAIKFSDLDGDGLPDMVYIDVTNGLITIQKNNGAGKPIDCSLFSKVLALDNTPGSAGFLIGDINNDGLPDIVCGGTTTTGYFLNTSTKGNIQFAPFYQLVDDNLAGIPYFLDDLDQDGRADISCVQSIFRNATTENSTNITLKPGFVSQSSSTFKGISDIDGDSKPDLITLNTSDGVLYIRTNNSVPGFLRDTSFNTFSLGLQPSDGVIVSDLDNDGKPDIISNGTFYKNNSSTLSGISFPKGEFISDQIDFITDLNGDGIPELGGHVSLSSGQIQDTALVYQNRAVLGQPPVYSNSVKYNYNYNIDPGSGASGEFNAVEDLNNDNKPDLIFYDDTKSVLFVFENVTASVDSDAAPRITGVSPAGGNINSTISVTGSNFNATATNNQVYFGQTRATVIAATSTLLSVTVPPGTTNGAVSVTDITTKLSASSSNTFKVTQGDGKGSPINNATFQSAKQLLSGLSAGNFAYADLNHDGKNELIILNQSTPTCSIYTSSTTDASGNPTNFTKAIDLAVGKNAFNLMVADLNGDGLPEILVTDNQGLRVFENNTSTVCGWSFLGDVVVLQGDIFNLTVADVNGDGKPDIFAIFNGYINVLVNYSKRGSISFDPYQLFEVPQAPYSEGVYPILVKDFDGDGKPDIVFPLVNATYQVMLVRNLGATVNSPVNFAPAVYINVHGISDLALEDIDGDGKPDLLLLDNELNSIDVYKNKSIAGDISAASLAAPVSFKLSVMPNHIRIGDFDGDSKPDVLVMPADSAYILQNTGEPGVIDNSTFAKQVAYPVPSNSINSIVTDLNNDGRADILYLSAHTVNFLQNNGPTLPVPTIDANGPLTFLSGGSVVLTANPAISYAFQWFKDGTAISGATAANYTANESGIYTVQISLNGLSKLSDKEITVKVVIELPPTNFKLTITSATCKGNSDGSVNITAAQSMAYTATITGNGLSTPYPFTTSAAINNLAAGSYQVCITVAGQPDYSQCYDVVITEPKDLSVYSVINIDNSITLGLSGGTNYNVVLNGAVYSTSNNSITLPLGEGTNYLSVTTDRLCQGSFKRLINISGKIIPYPVPFVNTLSLNLGNTTVSNVGVEIHNVADGKLVYSKQYANQSGVIELDLSNLQGGTYALHLSMDSSDKIFKIVKK